MICSYQVHDCVKPNLRTLESYWTILEGYPQVQWPCILRWAHEVRACRDSSMTLALDRQLACWAAHLHASQTQEPIQHYLVVVVVSDRQPAIDTQR